MFTPYLKLVLAITLSGCTHVLPNLTNASLLRYPFFIEIFVKRNWAEMNGLFLMSHFFTEHLVLVCECSYIDLQTLGI